MSRFLWTGVALAALLAPASAWAGNRCCCCCGQVVVVTSAAPSPAAAATAAKPTPAVAGQTAGSGYRTFSYEPSTSSAAPAAALAAPTSYRSNSYQPAYRSSSGGARPAYMNATSKALGRY